MNKRTIVWIIIVFAIISIPLYYLTIGVFNVQFGPDADMQNETQWICRESAFRFAISKESAPYNGTVVIREREYPVELIFHDLNSVIIMFGQSEEDVPLIDVSANYLALPNKIIVYDVYVPLQSNVPSGFYQFFQTSFVFEKVQLNN